MTTLNDLALNDLMYLADTDASRSINRQIVKFYSEKSTYSQSQRIIFKIHGNMLRDFNNSSLKIDFTPNGGQAAFGDGASATSLFNRVRVLAPTGEAISDVLNLNLYDTINSKLKESKEYEEVAGGLWGGVGGSTADGATREFIIPLCKLSPFFNSKQLVPPQLANGMIIEFYLETAEIAYNSAGVTTYKIGKPELLIDSVQLASDALASVLSFGTKGGDALVYEFTDVVESETFSPASDSEIFFDVPQSCTNGLEAITVIRRNERLVQSQYSLRTAGPRIFPSQSSDDQVIFQIGETRLPRQRAIGGSQIYQLAMHSQGAVCDKSMSNFSLDYFKFENEQGCYCCDLRTSKIFNNSGREVSNAQRLNVFIKYHTPADLVCNVFLSHISRVVVSNGNLSVER